MAHIKSQQTTTKPCKAKEVSGVFLLKTHLQFSTSLILYFIKKNARKELKGKRVCL